jgi:copper chaperone
MTTERFEVRDMSCGHCVQAIQQAVAAVPGVAQVEVMLDTKTVTVQHGPEVGSDTIVQAINDAGYEEISRLN